MATKFEIIDLEERIAPSLLGGLLGDLPHIDADVGAAAAVSADVAGIISVDAGAMLNVSLGT